MTYQTEEKKLLILYYSFSSQTKNLLQACIHGLEEHRIKVALQRLEPIQPLRFPVGNIYNTIKMMLLTFLRRRIPIQQLNPVCFDDYHLIILAGPTWSYNPSGPVLALLDRHGNELFKGKKVIAFISCRGYWRAHWLGLRHLLKKKGAIVSNLIVFSHPSPEPWRTIGVFLKLAGRNPEKKSWISKYYKKYGHTRQQFAEARRFGTMIAVALENNTDIRKLNFKTAVAIP